MIAVTRRITLAAAAAVALHAAPAAAKDEASFVFTPLVPPGGAAPEIYLTGIYQDRAVGYYANQKDVFAGFVWSSGNYAVISGVQVFNALSDNGVAIGNTTGSTTSYTTYDVTTGTTNTINFAPPGGCYFAIGGINSSGEVAASQGVLETKHNHFNDKAAFQPFEQNVDGSYAWLAKSKGKGLSSIGVTDDGVVVLAKSGRVNSCGSILAGSPYSLYANGKLQKFSVPGAKGPDDIEIDFVTGSGFGGGFTDTKTKQNFGLIATGAQSKITTYSIPSGSVFFDVLAIGPHSEVAGYTLDASGYYHGFIYADQTYYTVDYPRHKSTWITGFSSTGAIIGYFGDNDAGHGFPEQPFIATCASAKGCTK